MMKMRKWNYFKFMCIAAALLLGQFISGAGLAQSGEAGYQDWLPVVSKYLGYRESIGVLDPSFGEGGKVFTDIGISEAVHDVDMQSDGKILAVGYTSIDELSGTVTTGEIYMVALLRYNRDGSLDESFGSGGKVVTDIGDFDRGNGIAVQPDGRIVIAGYSDMDYANGSFMLARYLPDGSLDTSFDDDGIVIIKFNSSGGEARAVVIQPDGKILAAGSVSNGMDVDFALARYNTDGSLDEGFGSGGKVITDFYGDNDYGYSIILQPDGKIILGGQAGNCPYSCMALARYNPNGSLDTSFGGDGKVTANVSVTHDHGYSAALQADGKILIAGDAGNESGGSNFALVRYHSNGDVDLGFGVNGIVITLWGCDSLIQSIAVQPNGKIVAAGNIGCGSGPIALARYKQDGSLDESFGYLGMVMTELNDYSYCFSLILQADGKLVVGGFAGNEEEAIFNIALARYK